MNRALAERQQSGRPGSTTPRVVAAGDGWRVADVICTCGRDDRVAAEQHDLFVVAPVLAGTFQYRSPAGHAVMTPGSIMLGSPGHAYECRHDHGAGDRCVSFWYAPAYVERLAADLGLRSTGSPFRVPALPALRETAGVIARSGAGLFQPDADWSEYALELAARVMAAASEPRDRAALPSPAAIDRVSSIVRFIDREMEDADALSLDRLAARVEMSPFHFLRTFGRVTGLTPHQYVRRTRLRLAATRLVTDRSRILDVALDCGFGDVSAFNRAFRTEFGVSPRQYRRGR